MNLTQLIKTIRQIIRVESLIAEVQVKTAARRMVLLAVAVAMGVLGFVMLNIAGYGFLRGVLGPVWAPFILGCADFLLSCVAILAALSVSHGPEFELALGVRKALADQLDEQVKSTSLLSLARPSGSGLSDLLIPAAVAIFGALRGKAGSREQPKG